MLELSFNKIKKYLNTHLLFEDVSFNIYNKEKVGLVGSNGCGKTTILKIIAGIEEMGRYDEGRVSIPKGTRIGYLQQHHIYETGSSVKEVLNGAFRELIDIEKEMSVLEEEMKSLKGKELDANLKRYSYLQGAYELGGGYEKETQLKRICEGLKIGEEFLKKKFEVLSGGEKTTVALGKILLESPDILLLDEPTNHLDMESVEWLEGYINEYKGMVLIVSHDRYFLDNTVNKIIDIEFKRSKTYNGNYSRFMELKEEELMKQFQDYKEQQKLIRLMKDKIKKYKELGNKKNSIKFYVMASQLQLKLNSMERIMKPKTEKDSMKLKLIEGGCSGKEVVVGEKIHKGFNGHTLLENAELFIQRGERVALIGANGSGKSTFLNMLLGDEKLDSGTLKIGASLEVAYLPQDIQFEDVEATAIDYFRKDYSILEGDARGYLAKFMFFGGDPYKKIAQLSGGEKIRLELARLLYREVNFLVLDEPTNHLDIESIRTIENALKDFGGTIFCISHDRFFINNISSKIIELKDKKLNVYHGNYEEYKKIKSTEKEVQLKTVQKLPIEKEKKKVRKKNEADKERKREQIEKKIDRIEKDILELDKAMEKAGHDYVELQKLSDNKRKMDCELEELIVLWEKIS